MECCQRNGVSITITISRLEDEVWAESNFHGHLCPACLDGLLRIIESYLTNRTVPIPASLLTNRPSVTPKSIPVDDERLLPAMSAIMKVVDEALQQITTSKER